MNLKKISKSIAFLFKNIIALILLMFCLNVIVISIFQTYQFYKLNFREDIRGEMEPFISYDWGKQYFLDQDQIEGEYYPFVGWKEKPLVTSTLNIDEDGYRISRNNSKKPDVFFLGGSTLFGYGSNDENTIPSLFAKFTNDTLTVRNLGNGGHTSSQNLIKIQDELLNFKKPKYIISYEGANEIQNLRKGVNSNYKHLFYLKFKKAIENNLSYKEQLNFKSLLESQTKFLETFMPLFLNKIGFVESEPLHNTYDINQKSFEKSVDLLLNNWKILSLIGKEEKIKVFLFLQPVVYSNDHNTDYLVDMVDFKTLYDRMYFLIKEKISSDPSLEIVKNNFYDLSKKLDEKGSYFYDHVHINAKGNSIIAKEITKQIFK